MESNPYSSKFLICGSLHTVSEDYLDHYFYGYHLYDPHQVDTCVRLQIYSSRSNFFYKQYMVFS
jgi:hypothetical protein